MDSSLLTYIRQSFTYVKQHPQILFALMLLFVIPLLFLYTGQQFLEVGRYNQDRLQKDKVGVIHDALVALAEATSINLPVIETQMRTLATNNPDIIDLQLLTITPEGVTPLIALDQTAIGIPETNAKPFSTAQLSTNESVIFEANENGVRYWYGYRSFTGADDTTYFLYTKQSLAGIDQLMASREFSAYVRLLLVYIFLLILAVWHIRLTNYRYLYTEARQAIETKDLFTHMIAHELRAPLTAIRGYASLLKEHLTDTEPKEQAARIETSSERLIAIVNDLLDIARLQSRKLEVSYSAVDLNSVITEVVNEFTPIATAKDCRVLWTASESVQSIYADQKRVHQILTNIISNAIKYTEHGIISVTTEAHRSTIEVRVKDTGTGISSIDQKKLFAPFFRTQDAEASTTTGTGLGMWITKELIELMGGTIGVESMQGVGTQIVMTFPRQQNLT
jgi:signal transduction histidine kinase